MPESIAWTGMSIVTGQRKSFPPVLKKNCSKVMILSIRQLPICNVTKYNMIHVGSLDSLTHHLFRINGRLTLRSKLNKPLPHPDAMILRSFTGRLDRSLTQVCNIFPSSTSELTLKFTPLPSPSVSTSLTKYTEAMTSSYVPQF